MRSLLLLVAAVGAVAAVQAHRQRQHTLLMTRYGQFYNSFSNRDMATAYGFMSPKYKELYTLKDFIGDSELRDLDFENPVVRLSLLGNSASLYQYKSGHLYSGDIHYWKRSGGKWCFTGETDWFLD